MNFWKTLFLRRIVLINLVSLTIAQPPKFLGNFSYYDGSTSTAYQTNRDTLLSSLAAKTDRYGFYTSSEGKNADTVYALVLCRADVALDVCRDCINNSTDKLKQLYPDSMEAIGWYDDCMLRYSNKSMRGILDVDKNITGWNDKQNVSSPELFKEVLVNLLESLKDEAAAGGSLMKFASGNRTGPDHQIVYALTQCTPDLSKTDCGDCIQGAIDDIPTSECCNGPAGGRILRASCNFRFELSSFVGEVPETSRCRGLMGTAVVSLNFLGLALVLNFLI